MPDDAELQLTVFDRGARAFSTRFSGPLELGRKRMTDGELYSIGTGEHARRLVVAGETESDVSRKLAIVERCGPALVRIQNFSKNSLTFDMARPLAGGATAELSLPVIVRVGQREIHLAELDVALVGLVARTPAPGSVELPSFATAYAGSLAESLAAADEQLGERVAWLHAMIEVLQSAATDEQFMDKAARLAAATASLDCVAVLQPDGAGWKVLACCAPGPQDADKWRPSATLLRRAQDEKRTFRYIPSAAASIAVSQEDVLATVAAPILNAEAKVIGVLYGDRRVAGTLDNREPLTEAQATLFELVACGIAAGLARVEREQAALKARTQFEQFFTPQLARQLTQSPELLVGRDADVSILVCDIAGYSRVSERLRASGTVEWINDVLSELSACVLDREGVLVDYVGDQLLAMWGAPSECADHAVRACDAALAMIERLPALDARWREKTIEPLRLAIGINSGQVSVGNIGSRQKFKYGPMGPAVNIASRVMTATSHYGVPIFLSQETVSGLLGLEERFAIRRIGHVTMVNIGEPVELFELSTARDDMWQERKRLYEAALAALNEGKCLLAIEMASQLLRQFENDGPAKVMLRWAHKAHDGDCDPRVHVLPHK